MRLEQVICVTMSPSGPNAIEWRKSSYSVNGGACVEVMAEQDAVGIRDSADRPGSVVVYSSNAWRAFLCNVKDSEMLRSSNQG